MDTDTRTQANGYDAFLSSKMEVLNQVDPDLSTGVSQNILAAYSLLLQESYARSYVVGRKVEVIRTSYLMELLATSGATIAQIDQLLENFFEFTVHEARRRELTR